MQQNPLLTNQYFIPFEKFTIGNLKDALNARLAITQNTITQIEATAASSWATIAEPLHYSLYMLNSIWGLVGHLLAVNDSPELRELYNEFQPIITKFYVDLGQNHKLYAHYINIRDNQTEYSRLDATQKKALDNEFRDFFLNGINLNKESQQHFKASQTKLGELTTKFEQNILDATDKFSKFVTLDELHGVPKDTLEMYKTQAADDPSNATNDDNPHLYKITLHMPSYLPLMQYCDNRKLREELYHSYVTRASEFGDLNTDNTQIIQDILRLRDTAAKLLDFESYAALSLYTKMAQNQQEVIELLNTLALKSKKSAQNDIIELTKFAKDTDNIDKLDAWDIPYYSEKLQQQKYSYSNQELKQYFQLPVVLNGLFNLIKQLYNVEFVANGIIPVWHDDMQTFDVFKDGALTGHLYLDLFARKGKQSGAWMNSAQDKFNTKTHKFLPMAYVICNFTPPTMNTTTNNMVSLLTFDEVQTLFHEMGHALHHLLTQIAHFTISGINGVEWDAVELPSQFMEYFTWNYSILTTITKHIDSNETMPIALYDKLLKSRFYQSGLQMLRQIEFALFDITLHSTPIIDQTQPIIDQKNNPINYLQILDAIRNQIAVVYPPSYNRFPNTFSHIFAGGYASGYYSYKWAEVLAADVFSRFDMQATPQEYAKLGKMFLNTILSTGGLNPMVENVRAFLGRSPQIEALLKYSGIEIF
jgi:oligopeptidase A